MTLTAILAVGGFCVPKRTGELPSVSLKRAVAGLTFGEGLEGVATGAAERELSRHTLVLKLAVGGQKVSLVSLELDRVDLANARAERDLLVLEPGLNESSAFGGTKLDVGDSADGKREEVSNMLKAQEGSRGRTLSERSRSTHPLDFPLTLCSENAMSFSSIGAPICSQS